MGIDIMESRENSEAIMYCNTTGWAFGPVMPSVEIADAFLAYLKPTDPRTLTDNELEAQYSHFVRENVCECDTIRETECIACKFDGPPTDGMHCDSDGDTERCRIEPMPANGERFECEYCKRRGK